MTYMLDVVAFLCFFILLHKMFNLKDEVVDFSRLYSYYIRCRNCFNFYLLNCTCSRFYQNCFITTHFVRIYIGLCMYVFNFFGFISFFCCFICHVFYCLFGDQLDRHLCLSGNQIVVESNKYLSLSLSAD